MNHNFWLKRLVISGLLVALGVVLEVFVTIPAFPLGVYSLKIGFALLPVILSGVLFGPLYGGLVGGATDFLQAILRPMGAYVPWFTLVGALFGLIPGLFFAKRQAITLPRVFCAVFAGQVIGSVVCNTLLVSHLYNMPLATLLPARLINQAVMIPVYTLLTYYLAPIAGRLAGVQKKDSSPAEESSQ